MCLTTCWFRACERPRAAHLNVGQHDSGSRYLSCTSAKPFRPCRLSKTLPASSQHAYDATLSADTELISVWWYHKSFAWFLQVYWSTKKRDGEETKEAVALPSAGLMRQGSAIATVSLLKGDKKNMDPAELIKVLLQLLCCVIA